MTQPVTELHNAIRVTTHQANGANLGTFRVVHQIKVHICVLWEAMYYMFTSGGQCTTCSHQVVNVLYVHIRWSMYYMFTSGGQCTTCSHQVVNVLHVHIRWPMYYLCTLYLEPLSVS